MTKLPRRFLSLLLGLSHLLSSVQAAPPEWLVEGMPESERASAKVSLNLDTVTELDFGFFLKYRQADPEDYSEAKAPSPAPAIPENFWKTLRSLKNLHNLSLKQIGEFLDLTELRHFSNLTTLKLGWTFLSGPKGAAHLASLQPLVNLVYLNLSSNHIGERGFAQLMTFTFPKLEYLILSRNQLNGNIEPLLWGLLSKFPKLWELDISLNDLGLEGAKALASLKQLKALWIGDCGLGDRGFKALTPLKQLTHLSVDRNSLTSEGAGYVAAFKDLEVLDISYNALEATGLKPIGTLLQLRDLNLSNTQLKGRDIASLRPLKRLAVLNLSLNDLDSLGMSLTSQLVNLKTLNVENTGIDEADLPVFNPLTKLKELSVSQKGLRLQVKTEEELLAYPPNLQRLLGTPEVLFGMGKKLEQQNKWEKALGFYNQVSAIGNEEIKEETKGFIQRVQGKLKTNAPVEPTQPKAAVPAKPVEQPIQLVQSKANPIPEIARGYEERIYQMFLKGKLIYRPTEGSDAGKIELPIASLANPLEGTFDLSRCGDTRKYLSIATDYKKGKKVENSNKRPLSKLEIQLNCIS